MKTHDTWTEPAWAVYCDCAGRALLLVCIVLMTATWFTLSLLLMKVVMALLVPALVLSVLGYIPTWKRRGK